MIVFKTDGYLKLLKVTYWGVVDCTHPSQSEVIAFNEFRLKREVENNENDIFLVRYRKPNQPKKEVVIRPDPNAYSCIQEGNNYVKGNFRIITNRGANIVWHGKLRGKRRLLK